CSATNLSRGTLISHEPIGNRPFLPHAPLVTISPPARASTISQNLPARAIRLTLVYTWVITVSAHSASIQARDDHDVSRRGGTVGLLVERRALTAPSRRDRRWGMTTVPLGLQRKCEQRWDARYKRPAESASSPEHRLQKQDQPVAAPSKGRGKRKARQTNLSGS